MGPGRRPAADRGGSHVYAPDRGAGRSPARPCHGIAHGRLAPDPQPRHGGRQPRLPPPRPRALPPPPPAPAGGGGGPPRGRPAPPAPPPPPLLASAALVELSSSSGTR